MTNAEMKSGRYLRWARARRMLAWVNDRIAAGLEVLAVTHTRATKLNRAEMRATRTGFYVRHGAKWIDYSHTELRAQ